MWPEPTGGFQVWLPVFVVLGFVVIRVIAGLRIGVATSIAALVGGTLWAWWIDTAGVIPASAGIVLVAFVAGSVIRRRARRPAA